MTSTTFVNRQTVITSDWLNDVNTFVYNSGIKLNAAPPAGGFWPDVNSTTKMLKLRDRVFVSDGVEFTGNYSGTQSGFVPTSSSGANWASRDSRLFVASDKGLMAVTGFVSNANLDPSNPTESIGVSGFVIGNKASRNVWGLYSDVQFEQGNYGYGLEIAVKNKGSNTTSTPYFATTGTYGIWLPGGGDASYGGSPTNPNNTAIAIGKNSTTWNKGIVFYADGLTGDDGTTGTATAIEMAKGHIISWRAPGNYSGFSIRSDVSSSGNDVGILAGNSTIYLQGTGGVTMGKVVHVASGVNYIGMLDAVAGSGASLFTDGTDSNIDLLLSPKGTGVVRFGTRTAIGAETVTGYITIKDSGGTTRKLAVVS